MTNGCLCSENIALQVPTLTVTNEGDVTAVQGPEAVYCTPVDMAKANTDPKV